MGKAQTITIQSINNHNFYKQQRFISFMVKEKAKPEEAEETPEEGEAAVEEKAEELEKAEEA